MTPLWMSYKSTFFAPFPCLPPSPPPTPSVFSLTPSLFIVLFFNYCCSPCALLCPLSLTRVPVHDWPLWIRRSFRVYFSVFCIWQGSWTESQQHCHLNEIHTMTRPGHRPVQMGKVSQGPTLDKERKENQSSPETSPQVDFPIPNGQL